MSNEYAVPSISMRDYFAAAALTGLLASQSKCASSVTFAEDAYRLADAMIKAKAKDEATSKH